MSDQPATPYRRYRAPQADGAALILPAARGLQELIERNRQRHASPAPPAMNLPARRELLELAYRFTSSFCDVPKPSESAEAGPLVVSGHQPELFHPGVWFKNLALDAIAKTAGGVGVHLLIDSDLCRDAAVRAPTGPIDTPRAASIAYDLPAAPAPHEERAVADPDVLASFGDRVAEALDGLVDRPLAAGMVGDLTEAAKRTGNLGLALSQARRRVEARWGSATLELPISAVCDTHGFRRFAGGLLGRLPDLHEAYNGALADYRRGHRIRTPARPLPDLKVEQGWWEAPLWVWTEGDPTRRALFVRADRGGLELTDRAGGDWSVGAPQADPAEWLADLRSRGVKIRSRALITTLYSRLVLGDLFLHGIGGAKYDEVTDELARRLFGAAPPHATLTATLRLPIDRPRVDPHADARLRRELRELRYHPEHFVDRGHPNAGRLIGAKRAALSAPVELGRSNLARHERIERANAALQPLVAGRREAINAELRRLAAASHADAVLGSREYSFCLFPEPMLREQMTRLVAELA